MTQAPNAVGILAVGAEGVSEIEGEDWWRESTESERVAFEQACRESIRANCGEEKASKFSLSNFLVDGTGRPYWLITVLDDAPEVAKDKARKFSRVLRLTD